MSPTSAPARPTAPPAKSPADPPTAPRPAGPSRWAADLLLGARFAVAGGWEGWIRTLLTAVGVGLGVAVLLLAASVPSALEARQVREQDRTLLPLPGQDGEVAEPAPSDTTALVKDIPTTFRDEPVMGWLLQPDGDHPPVPPGVSQIPAPGEAVVSPALRDLLSSEEGELLRERLPYEIVGTVGDAGLREPGELLYYAGSDELTDESIGSTRIEGYGNPVPGAGLDGVQVLLVVVVCVVLLLPVAVFLATAVRFGSERRDRRLAALRLVGADIRMTRRSAAGEALVGAAFGLALGGVLFLLLRQVAESLELMGLTVFSADLRPDPGIAASVVLAVVVAAVAVSLLAMRSVVVEPLGVVRRGARRRRRLWWRLALPAVGVLLLLPLLGNVDAEDSDVATYQLAAGMVLVLFGITTVLPWLLERVVGALRGGPVPLQLATRRLLLDGESAVRAVGGITVAVAGAIAVQLLFGSVSDRYVIAEGSEEQKGHIEVYFDRPEADLSSRVDQEFATLPGVRDTVGVTEVFAEPSDGGEDLWEIAVADCATLQELARIDTCRDGQVFLPRDGEVDPDFAPPLEPGTSLNLAFGDGEGEDGAPAPKLWEIPADATEVTARSPSWIDSPPDALVTPSALASTGADDTRQHVWLISDPNAPDVLEHVRNTAAALDVDSSVIDVAAEVVDDEFAAIQRALYAGAVAVLLLIGASMVVSTLEQLRERRRLLSVLVAFGTRRSTLCWSVLWQTALPVVLGLALALGTGIGLGALLLRMISEEMVLDWTGMLAMTGLGAALILLVTVLSLPTLWRMLRPDGLRTE